MRDDDSDNFLRKGDRNRMTDAGIVVGDQRISADQTEATAIAGMATVWLWIDHVGLEPRPGLLRKLEFSPEMVARINQAATLILRLFRR